MQQIVDQDIKFVRRERLTTDVVEMFRKQGLNDKVRLLESSSDLYTVYYKLDNIIDSYYEPLAPSTGYIKGFDLEPYKEGMLLLGPDPTDVTKPHKSYPMEKMFKAFTNYVKFNDIVGLDDVGTLNKGIEKGWAPDIINVAELCTTRCSHASPTTSLAAITREAHAWCSSPDPHRAVRQPRASDSPFSCSPTI